MLIPVFATGLKHWAIKAQGLDCCRKAITALDEKCLRYVQATGKTLEPPVTEVLRDAGTDETVVHSHEGEGVLEDGSAQFDHWQLGGHQVV